METMEQYLYTFLNQKYGLKSLVLDWVTAIVNSIQAWSGKRKLTIKNNENSFDSKQSNENLEFPYQGNNLHKLTFQMMTHMYLFLPKFWKMNAKKTSMPSKLTPKSL